MRNLLTGAGFGVLTEIDLAATLLRQARCGDAAADDPGRVPAAVGDGARGEVFDPAVMAELSPALAKVAHEAGERLSGMMRALTGDEEEPDATRA